MCGWPARPDQTFVGGLCVYELSSWLQLLDWTLYPHERQVTTQHPRALACALAQAKVIRKCNLVGSQKGQPEYRESEGL